MLASPGRRPGGRAVSATGPRAAGTCADSAMCPDQFSLAGAWRATGALVARMRPAPVAQCALARGCARCANATRGAPGVPGEPPAPSVLAQPGAPSPTPASTASYSRVLRWRQESPAQPRHLQSRTLTAGQRVTGGKTEDSSWSQGLTCVRSWPRRAMPAALAGGVVSSELVCGTSCHRRCGTLLLYLPGERGLRLSNCASDLWS